MCERYRLSDVAESHKLWNGRSYGMQSLPPVGSNVIAILSPTAGTRRVSETHVIWHNTTSSGSNPIYERAPRRLLSVSTLFRFDLIAANFGAIER